METHHSVIFGSATRTQSIPDQSVHLVVTSPPYPMIAMWDACFCAQDRGIEKCLSAEDGPAAFERMHTLLDAAWKEVVRVLVPGGFACINIGDAVRTLKERFSLYPNHARIVSAFQSLAMTALPEILWRKQTNAPNKFMGSGMLPAGAYVTLEHEFILVFRKGGKRVFDTPQSKAGRHESAYFWEERNDWFSDVWFDVKGTVQRMALKDARNRSGAYPFEVPYRLINMYSVKGDTVLDPFVGTGTTLWAAMTAGRSSIGIEREEGLGAILLTDPGWIADFANHVINERLERHVIFVKERLSQGKTVQHVNDAYGFPVMTQQERHLVLNPVKKVTLQGHVYTVSCGREPEWPIPESSQAGGQQQQELFGEWGAR